MQQVANGTAILSDCPALGFPSVFSPDGISGGRHFDIPRPMLDIVLFGKDESSGLANVWFCEDQVYAIHNFTNYDPYNGTVTAICQAGNAYQWGFSFLLLFLVCIAQSLFAIIVYALWIEAHRNMAIPPRKLKRKYPSGIEEWEDVDYPSTLSHAVNMVRQAEEVYGDGVKLWSARRLDDVVWRGKEGMRTTRLPEDDYELPKE